MTKEASVTGLVPPVLAAVALAREVIEQDRADAAAFRVLKAELLSGLNQLSAHRDLTRGTALALLKIIYEHLSPLLGSNDEGSPGPSDLVLFSDHPALELMLAFIDVLADLDNGKTHDALAATTGRNAALPVHERRSDEALRDAVYILQRYKNFKNRSNAEHALAKSLRKRGAEIRGKQATQGVIKAIIDRVEAPSRESANRFGEPKSRRGRPRSK